MARSLSCIHTKPGFHNIRAGAITLLIEERDRLHAGYFETFAATHILAHDHVVTTDHVRLRLGKFGAIPFISAARELFLFRAHQPRELVFARLTTVRAGKGVGLPRFLFVEKIALIHSLLY
jgi:hypothetical protein